MSLLDIFRKYWLYNLGLVTFIIILKFNELETIRDIVEEFCLSYCIALLVQHIFFNITKVDLK